MALYPHCTFYTHLCTFGCNICMCILHFAMLPFCPVTRLAGFGRLMYSRCNYMYKYVSMCILGVQKYTGINRIPRVYIHVHKMCKIHISELTFYVRAKWHYTEKVWQSGQYVCTHVCAKVAKVQMLHYMYVYIYGCVHTAVYLSCHEFHTQTHPDTCILGIVSNTCV